MNKCYKCNKRTIGCHSKCDDYKSKNYNSINSEQDYINYLGEAKLRMKKSKNLFRRGVVNG